MPLEIQPARAVYDDVRDLVTFMGLDSFRLVRCSVTRDALFKLARCRAGSASEMLAVYRADATRIHRAAIRKYTKHQLNDDGSVQVQRSDIEAAAQHPMASRAEALRPNWNVNNPRSVAAHNGELRALYALVRNLHQENAALTRSLNGHSEEAWKKIHNNDEDIARLWRQIREIEQLWPLRFSRIRPVDRKRRGQ